MERDWLSPLPLLASLEKKGSNAPPTNQWLSVEGVSEHPTPVPCHGCLLCLVPQAGVQGHGDIPSRRRHWEVQDDPAFPGPQERAQPGEVRPTRRDPVPGGCWGRRPPLPSLRTLGPGRLPVLPSLPLPG